MNKFEIFIEISVGGISKEQLLQKLIEAGVQFNKYADTLFEHSQFSPTQNIEKIKLVKVKLSDFDLTNPCSYQEMVNRASALGLKLCPLYLAAFLRLEYLDQPAGAYLTIASAKLENDENYPNGFYVRNNENLLWLRGYRADDFCEWPAENEFVFILSEG